MTSLPGQAIDGRSGVSSGSSALSSHTYIRAAYKGAQARLRNRAVTPPRIGPSDSAIYAKKALAYAKAGLLLDGPRVVHGLRICPALLIIKRRGCRCYLTLDSSQPWPKTGLRQDRSLAVYSSAVVPQSSQRTLRVALVWQDEVTRHCRLYTSRHALHTPPRDWRNARQTLWN